MASRGILVYTAVLCAALSAAVVAGDAVEPLGSIVEASGQGEYLAGAQGGRKLLNGHDHHHDHDWIPGWVTHDGNVFAQANIGSGNTVQVGGKGDGHQQANSAAVNNAQINKDSYYNGVVSQDNNISGGRKLLGVGQNPPPKNSTTPAWIKDGKVYVFQGNLFSGNTVQAGNPHKNQTSQQANSAAVNNAQVNKDSSYNGMVSQNNNIDKSDPVIPCTYC